CAHGVRQSLGIESMYDRLEISIDGATVSIEIAVAAEESRCRRARRSGRAKEHLMIEHVARDERDHQYEETRRVNTGASRLHERRSPEDTACDEAVAARENQEDREQHAEDNATYRERQKRGNEDQMKDWRRVGVEPKRVHRGHECKHDERGRLNRSIAKGRG